MRRILGVVLLLALAALPLMAAKNSHTYMLTSDVKVGDVQLPQGQCNVTWTDESGSQAKLTIKTADKKTVTIPVHVVKNDENNFGVETNVVNGVSYLKEFHTPTTRFVVDNTANVGK
ncbi:MAG TPA: hypothetical protein VMU28_10200 [Terriglobales bacterium]|nr:hypothetical protein [Terriglobales bacterium]